MNRILVAKLKLDKFAKAYLNLESDHLTIEALGPQGVTDIVNEENLELAIEDMVISCNMTNCYNG